MRGEERFQSGREERIGGKTREKSVKRRWRKEIKQEKRAGKGREGIKE